MLFRSVDDRCYEKGFIVPAIDAAREEEASSEEIHLITQFGYRLLYCRFSSSCRSVHPQNSCLTIVIFDPVHDLLQNCLSGVWVAFWGIISFIRIVYSAWRDTSPEMLDTCVRLRFGLGMNEEVLASLYLLFSLFLLRCQGSFGAGDMEFTTANIHIIRMGEHLVCEGQSENSVMAVQSR